MEYFIGETLLQLRKRYGYKQSEVARRMIDLGCTATNQSVSRYEQDFSMPTAKQLIALCRIYNVHDVVAAFCGQQLPKYHMELNKEGEAKVEAYIQDLIASGRYALNDMGAVAEKKLAIYSMAASAGTGQFLDSSDFEMIEVGLEVPVNANFGVHLSGNSMEPMYHNGDIVWVEQSNDLHDGEVGLFLLDGEAYVKVLRRKNGSGQLLSLNKKYAPLTIDENSEFRVFGKVVGRSEGSEYGYGI